MFNKKLNTTQIICLSFFSVFTIMFIIGVKCNICFETNDDRIIMEIFSGTITGTPDAHAAHVNYLLGKIISSLYNVTKSIPWYGLFLVLCYFFSFFSILSLVLKNCKNIVEQTCFWVFGCILIGVNVYIISVIQYTTVAGVLAIAGYVWLLLDKCAYRKYIMFGIFEFLAILLRAESMLLVQPIGVCIFGAVILQMFLEKSKDIKTCLLEFCKCGSVLIVVFVLSYMGNYVIGDLNNADWKEYYRYHELRIEIVDYYGFPAYEDCKDILNDYDVSEVEYEGVRRYWLLDNVLDLECMEELLSLSKEQYNQNNSFSLIENVKKMVNYLRYNECYGYEIAVPCMYMLALFLIVASGKIVNILPVFALFCSRNLAFAYLVYRGRIPSRVVNILFVAELFLLFVICIKVFLESISKNNFIKYIIGLSIALCILPFSIIKVLDLTLSKSSNTILYAEYLQELFDYFEEKDCGILVCNDVTNYYTGKALAVENYQEQNYLVTGGWYYNSPMMNEAVENYKQKYDDNMEVVIFSDVSGWDHTYVIELLQEKYDVSLEQADYMSIEELGLNYSIYRIEGSLKQVQ